MYAIKAGSSQEKQTWQKEKFRTEKSGSKEKSKKEID